MRILSTFIIRPRLNLRRDSIFIASNHSWKLLLIPHHHHHHHHYHHSYPQARVSWCDQCYVPGPPHPWHHERRRGVQHCPGFSLVLCLFCLCFTCLSFCSLFFTMIDTLVLLSALLLQMDWDTIYAFFPCNFRTWRWVPMKVGNLFDYGTQVQTLSGRISQSVSFSSF